MHRLFRLLCFTVLAVPALTQTVPPGFFNNLQWRGIGPAATGGRIADIAVSKTPGLPAEVYVATTTGGVFKSLNEGVSFTPIFDRSGGMMSIGAVAVAPSDRNIVWVGTGEADNRQSSSWGDGVYKSVDGGRSWEKMGLAETRHVGRILIHPTDPNTVYVAAVGHLWGSNSDRGVFKTIDGGKTWSKVLYRDEHTGAIDMVMDPQNPEVLFAALYQRQRKGWGYNGGGPGSGIFRTSDGGAHWTELQNGLPPGDKGRIGLAIFPGDSHVVYAIVEGRPGGVFRSPDRGDTWQQMTTVNPRPSYYSRIFVDPKNASRVYIMGSNRGFFISDDAGRNFRDAFSGVHGEDHALWIDPDNTNHLIIGGDGGVSISFDRGTTWLFRINLPIGQFYNISVNNQDPFLVCGGLQDNGSWCTPSASRLSHGVSFKDAFNIGGGDGMQSVFLPDNHTLLVSSQNGNTNRLDLENMQRQSIGPVQPIERPSPSQAPYRWYWTTPLVASSHNPNVIYTAANVLFRSDDRGMNWKPISPDLTANIDRRALEMMGAPVPPNALSRDDGQSNFSALTVIAESPLDRNLLYTGADDGSVRMTRDGGKSWSDLTRNVKGLPPLLNVSGIVASKYSAGRVYLTVDGHFNDDYRPYVFVSENYGKTWTPIANGLPQTSVHRIREHPDNPNFLVAGLEMGAYATFDRGAHWVALGSSLPPVPVYDLQFQEGSQALVLGTHGRSIYVLDEIGPLARITPEILSGGGYLFPVRNTHYRTIQVGQFWFGAGEFFAPNPLYGAVLTYYLPSASGAAKVSITDSTGKVIRVLNGPAEAGLNRMNWDLRYGPALPTGVGPTVLPGKYSVSLTPAGGVPLRADVVVEPDPLFKISDADRNTRFNSIMTAYSLARQLVATRDTIDPIRQRLAPGAIERIGPDLSRIQAQIGRTVVAANTLVTEMDGYEGLPTGAQLRQLEWDWADGAEVVAALNRLIQQEFPDVKPVPTLTRP